jgi:hypothetical protein
MQVVHLMAGCDQDSCRAQDLWCGRQVYVYGGEGLSKSHPVGMQHRQGCDMCLCHADAHDPVGLSHTSNINNTGMVSGD